MEAHQWHEAPLPTGNLRIIVLSRRDAESLEDEVTAVTTPGFEAAPELQSRQLLSAASRSPNHLWHFLDSLGQRLKDASSWATVVKGLLLVHRLQRCGSPAVEADLGQMLAAREGGGQPALCLSSLARHFVQKPGPVAKERTELVRAYALFLLERLKCAEGVSLVAWARRASGAAAQSGSGSKTGPGSASGPGSDAATGEGRGQAPGEDQGQGRPGNITSSANGDAVSGGRGFGEAYWREQTGEAILAQVASLQGLLGRLVACRPAPCLTPARYPFLVEALELVLKDSFDLYSSLNYAMMELVERFGTMARDQAFASLEVYRRSAQQAEELALLYHAFGEMGIGQGISFPTVTIMGPSYLRSLENYLVDEHPTARESSGRSAEPSERSNPVSFQHGASMMQMVPMPNVLGQSRPSGAAQAAVKAAADQQYDATWRALFATDRYSAPASAQTEPPAAQPTSAGRPTLAQPNALATWHPHGQPRGTFMGPQAVSWEAALDSSLSQQGKGQWELALASRPAAELIPHPPQPVLPGGFDQLLLDSLYQAAEAQKRVYHQGLGFEAGALHQSGPDPFAASAGVAPPAYVQMAIRAQQQMAMLLQRQLMAKHAYYTSMMSGGTRSSKHMEQVMAGTLNNWRNPDNIGVRYGNVLVPYS